MRRGEVWWADLEPPTGPRPVVLLSRNEAYAIRDFVTIAPVTTRIRRIPSEVRLGAEEGLTQASVANLDSVMTVPKARLRHRMGVLSSESSKAVAGAIRFALGLEER